MGLKMLSFPKARLGKPQSTAPPAPAPALQIHPESGGGWSLGLGWGWPTPGGQAPPLGCQGWPAVPLSFQISCLLPFLASKEREQNECLAPLGFALLQHMAQHPLGAGEEKSRQTPWCVFWQGGEGWGELVPGSSDLMPSSVLRH